VPFVGGLSPRNSCGESDEDDDQQQQQQQQQQQRQPFSFGFLYHGYVGTALRLFFTESCLVVESNMVLVAGRVAFSILVLNFGVAGT